MVRQPHLLGTSVAFTPASLKMCVWEQNEVEFIPGKMGLRLPVLSKTSISVHDLPSFWWNSALMPSYRSLTTSPSSKTVLTETSFRCSNCGMTQACCTVMSVFERAVCMNIVISAQAEIQKECQPPLASLIHGNDDKENCLAGATH